MASAINRTAHANVDQYLKRHPEEKLAVLEAQFPPVEK
jgi:hypothetical protein